MLLTFIDGLVVMYAGADYKMNNEERALIEPAVIAMVSSLQPKTLKAVSDYSNIVSLGIGLLMWGSRIAKGLADAKDEAPEEKEKSVDLPQPKESGHINGKGPIAVTEEYLKSVMQQD